MMLLPQDVYDQIQGKQIEIVSDNAIRQVSSVTENARKSRRKTPQRAATTPNLSRWSTLCLEKTPPSLHLHTSTLSPINNKSRWSPAILKKAESSPAVVMAASRPYQQQSSPKGTFRMMPPRLPVRKESFDVSSSNVADLLDQALRITSFDRDDNSNFVLRPRHGERA